MNIENLAPIALFVYNRPWHTIQTLNALKLNDLAPKSDLVIFSDASKNAASENLVNEVRKIIATTVGFKSITVIERNENFGLAKSIIDGVSKICSEAGRVIVLEDDLVTAPYFLRFMNEALNLYETHDEVISVHGYMYPVKEKLPETFLLRGADCWGWATWERGWAFFEPDGKKLLAALNEKNLEKSFNLGNSYDYMSMLRDQIAGKVNSWAVRWHASAFLANKLTLYPGVSLVQNIGMDNSGTHCDTTQVFFGGMSDRPIELTNIPIMNDGNAERIITRFFFSIKGTFFKRVLNKIRSLI